MCCVCVYMCEFVVVLSGMYVYVYFHVCFHVYRVRCVVFVCVFCMHVFIFVCVCK